MQNMNPYQYAMYQQAYQPQYNAMQPQYERLYQMQSTQYNQPNYQHPPMLNGEIVDSIDVVKAKNVDMSGNPTIYPKSDMTEIYVKQLQKDGTSRIIVYKANTENSENENVSHIPISLDSLNSMFGQLKTDILQEIDGLKKTFSSEPSKTTRGGTSK